MGKKIERVADNVENNLMMLAETVRAVRIIISIILIVVGVISGFTMSEVVSEIIDYFTGEEVSGFITFMGIFIPYALIAAAVWLVGKLFESLLNYCADTHFYQRAQMEMMEEEFCGGNQAGAPAESTMKPGDWKCHACGRINKVYNTTCVCGQKKADN